MTSDRFGRRLAQLLDDLGQGDDAFVDEVLRQTVGMPQRRLWSLRAWWTPSVPDVVARSSTVRTRLVVIGVVVALLALVVGVAAFIGSWRTDDPPLTAANGWIAYSTMPGVEQVDPVDWWAGGDIYLVREGSSPKLIAGRLHGSVRNVCPAFSPDGRLLAFGRSADGVRSVVLMSVRDDGTTTETAVLPASSGPDAPCPMWSRDGMRIAYLERGAVVVRGLDGSVQLPGPGDPEPVDLARGSEWREGSLPSPRGDWIVDDEPAGIGDCDIFAKSVDGTERRRIAPELAPPGWCPLSIATWSPDGQWLLALVMDVGGISFTLRAMPLDTNARHIDVVSDVVVNGTKSWPGRGDVSWQAMYR